MAGLDVVPSTSVLVAAIDWASDRAHSDNHLRDLLGWEADLIRLPGPIVAPYGMLTRSVVVFVGDAHDSRRTPITQLVAACAPKGAATRMAFHAGDDVAMSGIVMRRGDLGQIVDRAVHLVDVAHQGQVVASDVGGAQLLAIGPIGVELFDLGWHRLRDLGAPAHVWQVDRSDSMTRFPPLRSLDAFRHNLPVMRSSLVGRDDEVRLVDRLLADEVCVTLTGTGGVGKSRLALSLAARTIERYPGGVWWLELVSVTDHDALDDVARGVMGADVLAAPSRQDEHVAGPPTLLVLDNCEHVAAASAALVAALTEANSRIRVVATSREPLGVSGETVWRVPSLPSPSAHGVVDVAEAQSYPSVRLFIERVRAHDLNFVLDGSNVASVAQVCARLDGIPLAVELAAGRCRQLGPVRVAEELDERFELLTQGPRTEHTRHQTISASIDWSHDRLGPSERLVFRRLGTFPGPFTLELASDVVTAFGDMAPRAAVDHIGHLVDRSLVETVDGGDGLRRFRLLETLRMYAVGRARAAGELDRLHEAHVSWWLAWFEGAGAVPGADAVVTAESLSANLRAALEWSSRDPRTGLVLLAHAARAWHGSSRSVDAVLASDRVLTDANSIAEPEAWRDAALMMSVHYAFVRGSAAVQELARQTTQVAERLGDGFSDAAACWIERSDDERSTRLRDHARERGDTYLEALASVTAAEHLAEREPMAAMSVLNADAVIATCGSDYLRSWAGLVRGRIARDIGDFATCLRIGRHLVSERSAHMVFNGMILLVQAGLLAASRDGLQAAIEAAAMPVATPRMIVEGEVARTHLAYLDNASASRVDPEFGREPMTPGSLWLCAREAIDAGHADLALGALDVAGPEGPLLEAVRSAVTAAAGDAERWYDALSMAQQLGLAPLAVDALEGVAMRRATHGNWVDCLRLFAAARSHRTEIDYSWQFGGCQEALLAAVRQSTAELSADAAAAALAEGAVLGPTEAAAYALRSRGRRGRPRLGWGSLTPTEIHVAALVAEGLSNRRIGEQMMISTATVKSHLDHIFTKLGVHSRTEVAAGYVRRPPPP